MNTETIKGQWNEIQGELKQRWAEWTDDDLAGFEGGVQELVGLIQRKTGEGREEVEEFVQGLTQSHDFTTQVREQAQRVVENVSEYTAQAGDAIREGTENFVDMAKQKYSHTEELVKKKPVESLAVCFGTGLIAGAVIGLVLRSR